MEYKIYQLRQDCPNYRDKSFECMDHLRRVNIKPSIDDYRVVYTGEIEWGPSMDVVSLCEKLFNMFQGRHPDGYTGHSMSVSDVVWVNGEFYYCDAMSFVKLESF